MFKFSSRYEMFLKYILTKSEDNKLGFYLEIIKEFDSYYKRKFIEEFKREWISNDILNHFIKPNVSTFGNNSKPYPSDSEIDMHLEHLIMPSIYNVIHPHITLPENCYKISFTVISKDSIPLNLCMDMELYTKIVTICKHNEEFVISPFYLFFRAITELHEKILNDIFRYDENISDLNNTTREIIAIAIHKFEYVERDPIIILPHEFEKIKDYEKYKVSKAIHKRVNDYCDVKSRYYSDKPYTDKSFDVYMVPYRDLVKCISKYKIRGKNSSGCCCNIIFPVQEIVNDNLAISYHCIVSMYDGLFDTIKLSELFDILYCGYSNDY